MQSFAWIHLPFSLSTSTSSSSSLLRSGTWEHFLCMFIPFYPHSPCILPVPLIIAPHLFSIRLNHYYIVQFGSAFSRILQSWNCKRQSTDWWCQYQLCQRNAHPHTHTHKAAFLPPQIMLGAWGNIIISCCSSITLVIYDCTVPTLPPPPPSKLENPIDSLIWIYCYRNSVCLLSLFASWIRFRFAKNKKSSLPLLFAIHCRRGYKRSTSSMVDSIPNRDFFSPLLLFFLSQLLSTPIPLDCIQSQKHVPNTILIEIDLEYVCCLRVSLFSSLRLLAPASNEVMGIRCLCLFLCWGVSSCVLTIL